MSSIKTMQIIEEIKTITPEKETLFTIGVFDGVHLGHRHLLTHLLDQAREHGWLSGVLTFKSHPQMVLRPDSNLALLDDLEYRIELIKSLGIDIVTALNFTLELSRLGPREFITLLKDHLKIRGLIIGPDFALGKDREGSASQLRALGREMDFTVETMPPFKVNGEVVSSSTIRLALSTGDMDKANKYLGRPFRLSGKVVHGDQRGGSVLGFPTANMEVQKEQAIPADGVYATTAYLNHKPLPAVTNIGLRPTFKGKHRSIETYIIDFHGELPIQEIKVEFVRRLRGEKRFDTPDGLIEQIQKDVKQAKLVLGK